jgi:hypothetical protein
MLVEVSNGEIADKLCIIRIKLRYIQDDAKRVNLLKEEAYLSEAMSSILPEHDPLFTELLSINTQLWHIEEACRLMEKEQQFDSEFIDIARSVYITNDERARVKKQINLTTNSTLIEEKSYQ